MRIQEREMFFSCTSVLFSWLSWLLSYVAFLYECFCHCRIDGCCCESTIVGWYSLACGLRMVEVSFNLAHFSKYDSIPFDCAFEKAWWLEALNTANLAAEAAISVSSSSLSFFFLSNSACSSRAGFSFKAAARATSAALSASAWMRTDAVEMYWICCFLNWCDFFSLISY